jgi:spore coat protein U-like protein
VRVGHPALALLLLLGAAEAGAVADCSLSSTGVAFGVYDPLSPSPTDSVGGITVACSHVSGGAERISYTVALATGGSGSYAARQLRAGPLRLYYNLFLDAGRSQVWGNGTGGTGVAGGNLTIGPGVGNRRREFEHSVYGRIPALQDVLSGSYTDTIIVTLEF